MSLSKVINKLVISTVVVFSSVMVFPPHSVYSQNSASFKVTNLWLNDEKLVAPGSLIASCIVERSGDIPYKRYALIYINYDSSSNNLKLVLEKTVVQWGGWEWIENSWFSPVTEEKSCRVSLGASSCMVALAGEINIKLELIDDLGNISVQKEMAK